jgi:ribonuclease P protein subunit POP4
MPPTDNSIAQSLLSRAHTPDTAAKIYTERVKTRPLFIKPAEHDNAQHQRRIERERKLASRKKKLKPKPLSSRQRKALCLYEIPKEGQKYSIYEPLHIMWVGYIQEVLGSAMPIEAGTAAKLCSADFHGAELEVVRSRCVGRVGIRGIVVRDSKFAFVVITRGNALKTVPKEHTIFRFTVPRPVQEIEGMEEKDGETVVPEGDTVVKKEFVFELHGDQFIFRAADRAMKKFKPKFNTDL